MKPKIMRYYLLMTIICLVVCVASIEGVRAFPTPAVDLSKFEVNGVRLGYTIAQVEAVLGKPTVRSGPNLIYHDIEPDWGGLRITIRRLAPRTVCEINNGSTLSYPGHTLKAGDSFIEKDAILDGLSPNDVRLELGGLTFYGYFQNIHEPIWMGFLTHKDKLLCFGLGSANDDNIYVR